MSAMDSFSNALERRIPTSLETDEYLSSRLCLELGPMRAQSDFLKQFFYRTCRIKDAMKAVVRDYSKGNFVCLEVDSGDEDGGSAPERYFIALLFRKPKEIEHSFRLEDCSIPKERRYCLSIDMEEESRYVRKARPSEPFAFEITVGARILASIIESCPSNNPKLKLYEDSIRWVSQEVDANKYAFTDGLSKEDGLSVLSSGISVSSFANRYLAKVLRKQISIDIFCHGESIDADHSRIRVSFPSDASIGSTFDGAPLEIEPTIEFMVSLPKKTVSSYICVCFCRDLYPEGWEHSMEEKSIRALAWEKLKDIEGICRVIPSEIGIYSPMASFDSFSIEATYANRGFADRIITMVKAVYSAFEGGHDND